MLQIVVQIVTQFAAQDRRENKGVKLSFIANTQGSCKRRIKRITTIGNLALYDLVAPACKNSGTERKARTLNVSLRHNLPLG